MLDYNIHERVLILEGEYRGRYGLVEAPHLTDPYAIYILVDGQKEPRLYPTEQFISVDPRGKRPDVAQWQRKNLEAKDDHEDILYRDPYDEAVVTVPRAFLERILDQGYTEQDELELAAVLASGVRRDGVKEAPINLALADTIRGTLWTAPESYVRNYAIEELNRILKPVDEEVTAQAETLRRDQEIS